MLHCPMCSRELHDADNNITGLQRCPECREYVVPEPHQVEEGITVGAPLDYRGLLIKYIRHVQEREGTTFLGQIVYSGIPFSPKEREVLEEVSAMLRAEFEEELRAEAVRRAENKALREQLAKEGR